MGTKNAPQASKAWTGVARRHVQGEVRRGSGVCIFYGMAGRYAGSPDAIIVHTASLL